MKFMKNLLKTILRLADIILGPFVYPASYLLKAIRIAGVGRMPLCKIALNASGGIPDKKRTRKKSRDTNVSISVSNLMKIIGWKKQV